MPPQVAIPAVPMPVSASNPFTSMNDLFGGAGVAAPIVMGQGGYVAPKEVCFNLTKAVIF